MGGSWSEIEAYQRVPRALCRFAAPSVQKRAKEVYQLFKQNPYHPGLPFKPIDPEDPTIYSARIGLHYRVVGTLQGDTITWFWIGTHSEYDKL